MGKKIVVACDGTWLDSDNGFKRTNSWFSSVAEGVLAVPSNVTQLCRALQSTHADGQPQICYYHAGLGSASNGYSFYVGGYLGEGISENIREAYSFVCQNYEPGDEIYLVGFSRGAFTARSIGGLIEAMGLLTRKGISDFYCIFQDWEHMADKDYYKPSDKNWIKATNIPEPRLNYGAEPEKYVDVLVKNGLTRPNVTVEATAVWDTVGQLGIPKIQVPPISWLQNQHALKAYSFINTEIPTNLRRAYQALALDERRTPFTPTVWEHPPDGTKTQLVELKQCWFAGAHSNVGGSYPDAGIADMTLAWMLEQLSPSLTFDSTFLSSVRAQYETYLHAAHDDRQWACGKVIDSGSKVQNFLAGASTRTPGAYTRMDPITGKPTKLPLRRTNETVHPSVRVRRALGGLGTGDSPVYNDPWPLKGWTLVAPGGTFAAKTGLPQYHQEDLWPQDLNDHWKWVQQAADGKIIWLVEDKLEGAEWDLVAKGSKAYDVVLAAS